CRGCQCSLQWSGTSDKTPTSGTKGRESPLLILTTSFLVWGQPRGTALRTDRLPPFDFRRMSERSEGMCVLELFFPSDLEATTRLRNTWWPSSDTHTPCSCREGGTSRQGRRQCPDRGS